MTPGVRRGHLAHDTPIGDTHHLHDMVSRPTTQDSRGHFPQWYIYIFNHDLAFLKAILCGLANPGIALDHTLVNQA